MISILAIKKGVLPVGPPLEAILFDLDDSDDKYVCYARQTAKAIRHIAMEFPDLNLHNRQTYA